MQREAGVQRFSSSIIAGCFEPRQKARQKNKRKLNILLFDACDEENGTSTDSHLALLISAVAGTVLVNLGTAAYVITTSPVNASSKTIVVPDEYPTIQAAIDAANAGDTVFVRKGTHDVFIGEYYNTEIFINKAISLIGEGRQETVIMGHYAHYTNVLITISADSVTISGFTMEGGLICGLSVLGSGCRITGNNVIGELEIFGENNVVTENNITGDRVYVFGSNNLISKNNVTGSLGAGIALDTCQNVTVRDNNIINNGINYDPHFGGGLYLNGGPFYIYRNNITDNDNFGIELYWNCSNAYIFNNNIVGNKIGIWLPLMKKDIIGVGNKVYYNNFIDNDKNVVVEQANPYRNGASNGTDVVSWDNGVVGNYWSDFNGQGHYFIDENNVDYHPLIQQVDISTTAPTILTIAIIAIAIVIAVAVALAVLLVYIRKRKR